MTPSGSAAQIRIPRVGLFIAIAFAFSWLQWLAVVASQHGWIHAKLSLTALGIFGPLVAAACVLSSGEEWRSLFRSAVKRRVPAWLIMLSSLGLPAAFIALFAVASVSTHGAAATRVPTLRTIAVVSMGMLLTAGIGEEPGWRGFLLPELRKSLGPVTASVVVAIVWFGWHLPLFWVAGATQREIPVVSFALGLVSYTFILTWLAEASANSMLLAVLFHTSANVTFWLAMTMVRGTAKEPVFSPAYVGLISLLGVAAAVDLWRRGRRATMVESGQRD